MESILSFKSTPSCFEEMETALKLSLTLFPSTYMCNISTFSISQAFWQRQERQIGPPGIQILSASLGLWLAHGGGGTNRPRVPSYLRHSWSQQVENHVFIQGVCSFLSGYCSLKSECGKPVTSCCLDERKILLCKLNKKNVFSYNFHRDGFVSLQEYMAFMISRETENVQSSSEVEQAFRALTSGEKPYITAQELYAVSSVFCTWKKKANYALFLFASSFKELIVKSL